MRGYNYRIGYKGESEGLTTKEDKRAGREGQIDVGECYSLQETEKGVDGSRV